MKFIAALLLGLALGYAGMLSAQTDSTAAPKKIDPNPSTALSWKEDKHAAKILLNKGRTEAAIPYLEAGAKLKPNKKYFTLKLASAYLELRDYTSSNKWYKVLIDRDSTKDMVTANLFKYALTQKYLGQYEQSIVNFTKFKKVTSDEEGEEIAKLRGRASGEVSGSRWGIFFRDSVPNPIFRVKPLDTSMDRPLAAYAPRLRDNVLYFSVQKSDSSFSRIYRSPRQGKSWGAVEALPENINKPGRHIGNGSFTADGNTLYYTQCQTGEMNKSKCQIYMSRYIDSSWEIGIPLGPVINDPRYTNMQPALGLDKDSEDVLYFVSDRNPGKGLDIFYIRIDPKDGTSFSRPHSAGYQINSMGDELSPYFDFRTRTLYFSSNGRVGIGGQDVFRSTWDTTGGWAKAENLGTPVNSSADDVGFYIDDPGILGFVVSNRPGDTAQKSATCCDNIYQITTTKLFLSVRGSVYEEEGNSRALADQGLVLLYDDRNGIELGSYNLISGGYFFDLDAKSSYKLVVRKDGFYDGVSSFTTNEYKDNDTLKYDLFLKKRSEPMISPLRGRVIGHVYYENEQVGMRADAKDSINSILRIMDHNPSIIVEVGGHTDSVGPLEYNMALSQKRAEDLRNYFVNDKKVSANRITAKGYGPTQPVAHDFMPDGKDNLAGQALNRRTEFKVIGELTPDVMERDAARKNTNEKPANVIKKDFHMGRVAAPSKPIPPKPAPAISIATTPSITSPDTAAAKTTVTTPAAKTPAINPVVNTRDTTLPVTIQTTNPATTIIVTTPAVTSPVTTNTIITPPVTAPTTNPVTTNVVNTAVATITATQTPVTAPATTYVIPPTVAKPAVTDTGYKTALKEPLVVTGTVYMDRSGTPTLANQASVFLTSNEVGSTQKSYSVKDDGSYIFDLSRSASDTFRLKARWYQFESDEMVITGADMRNSNKPIDLIIKMK